MESLTEDAANAVESVRETVGGLVESGVEQVDLAIKNIREWTGLCTSVAFHQPGLGMVHCRNLDWPLKQMKDATIILDCKSDAGPFRAVTVPGLVGVLSGVAKGRFSITINSNDVTDHFVPYVNGWSAALLVRWIFENCSSYDEALRELKKASGFVPFFATVVGLKRDEAAVVEVNMRKGNRYYEQPGEPVAVANHFPSESYEDDEDSNTQERQDSIETAANRCKAKSLLGCFSVLNEVLYTGTVQSMVLHPRSGEVLLQQL
jgi:predicted choloylglycine hydrolase